MKLNNFKALAVAALTAMLVVGVSSPVYAQKPKKEKAKKEKITDPRLLTVMKMTKMTKESQFLTKGVAMMTVHRATQGFAITADEQAMYFSQPGVIANNKPGLTKVHENYVIRRKNGKR
jgi:Flp pilus assembly protein TadD